MKTNLRQAIGTDISRLASKTDFTRLKIKVDNLDEDKLKTVTAEVGKLSTVADSNIVKNTLNGKMVIKVNAINTKIVSTS